MQLILMSLTFLGGLPRSDRRPVGWCN